MAEAMKKESRFDFSNVFSAKLGPGMGLETRELKEAVDSSRTLFREFCTRCAEMGFINLPLQDTSQIKRLAEKKSGFRNLVIFGIGGSALGTRAILSALKPAYHNLLPDEKRDAPRLFVEDNVDPDRLRSLFDLIDPEETLFDVVSKGGGTVETVSQLLKALDSLDKRIRDNVVITTGNPEGVLARCADEFELQQLHIPEGVGGRYSVLSAVGLFPSAVAGIDIDSLLEGARSMRERCLSQEVERNPAVIGALVLYLSYKKGRRIHILMPYADSLVAFAEWYCQLVAESLGKTAEVGPTPVRAVGVTDQHSQLQLYRDGPDDKLFTFISVEEFGSELEIPDPPPELPPLDHLRGKSFNELLKAEMKGTIGSLTRAGKPNYTITVPTVNEHTLGELFFILEFQVAFCGWLFRVNPFDQPGVDESKKLALKALTEPPQEEKPLADWVL